METQPWSLAVACGYFWLWWQSRAIAKKTTCPLMPYYYLAPLQRKCADPWLQRTKMEHTKLSRSPVPEVVCPNDSLQLKIPHSESQEEMGWWSWRALVSTSQREFSQVQQHHFQYPRVCGTLTLLPKSTSQWEFLVWLSRLQTPLVSMRMQVQSLTLLRGLKIQHCHELWCRSQTWLGSWVAVTVAA